ncbi:SERTA domain-containing protein 2b [Alosa pseudoharengus]|uniref:SERTA domain-containing protein 2b n=1 Tax=Alosa pseudoharengus TaxID=34774 RepID=UPI003F8A8B4D
MLGKGAKRKLDEDEEGLEGKALAVLSRASPSAGGCPEGPSFLAAKGVSYTLQRQTIFNISLLKLYSQRALTEPSLQRRVLINNMLRRIQDELKQEGALRPLPFPAPSPVPAAAAPHDHHPLDEGFRQASSSPTPAVTAAAGAPFGVLSSTGLGLPATHGSPANGLTLQPPPQAGLTPASLLEEDAGAFGALPPPPAPSLVPPSSTSSPSSSPLLMGAPCRPLRDSFSSALDEIEELCPSAAVAAAAHMTTSLSPSPLSVSSASSLPTSPSLSASSLHLTLTPALVPSLALSASDSKDCGKASSPKPDVVPMDTLPPAELDMSTSPSSCTSSTPSSCTTSSSSSSGFLTDLALDDILFADIDTSMYDFDPCTSTSGGAGASKLSQVVTADDLLKTLSSPGVTPSQPFKMDLTELDHIMEVLVGS